MLIEIKTLQPIIAAIVKIYTNNSETFLCFLFRCKNNTISFSNNSAHYDSIMTSLLPKLYLL